jgi:transposase
MSKSDLQTRPIFHRKRDAIRTHVLICFVAQMMGKYLELKSGASIRRVRDALWSIHEAEVQDLRTQATHTIRMDLNPLAKLGLLDLLNVDFTH